MTHVMKIAIQGQAGSFHADVAAQWYGSDSTLVPCTTFADVFDAYALGEADAMVVAVENTVYGSINEVYQLIESCGVPIVGEVKLPVAQQLIAQSGARPEDITEIYSHPVALAQCRDTLARLCPNAVLIEYFDTAGAVEYVASLDSPTVAAIASRNAAKLYGLPVLHPDVHDSNTNITRFLALDEKVTPPDPNRSSIVVTTNHKPGALLEVLQVFADAGINLAKLQSQPIVGQPWKYKFFIVADTADLVLHEALKRIKKSDHQVTLLGEYHADK